MKTHNLGLPRIGENRELKKALEQYWTNKITEDELESVALSIKEENIRIQVNNKLDLITVGDFSLYDHILDTTIMLGNIPDRFIDVNENSTQKYFSLARGTNFNGKNIIPSEMKKWFNTNYHYIVPEFTSSLEFHLNSHKIKAEIEQALQLGVEKSKIKPVIIGPLTYLWLGKSEEQIKFDLLPSLIIQYQKLLSELEKQGVEWIQIDEPILTLDNLSYKWKEGFKAVYNNLGNSIKIILTTYFENITDNMDILQDLDINTVHIDVTKIHSDNITEDCDILFQKIPKDMNISLGIISGRNIWISNYSIISKLLEPIYRRYKDRLLIAPSCSLLHLPITIKNEKNIVDSSFKYIKFAYERIDELKSIKNILLGLDCREELIENERLISELVELRKPVKIDNTVKDSVRKSPYSIRKNIQERSLKLPTLPTTTIGSFPQTDEIRKIRRLWKKGLIDNKIYTQTIKSEIKNNIEIQERLDLDVFVHGEPERTDMVEYFANLLDGYISTDYGWVQSYGSRCVKPAIVIKDIRREKPMTVSWIKYAQSLTSKQVKGMLTGPITMLKWSFVRQDIPYFQIAEQISDVLNQEIKDLISNGIKIIQIDEAAIKEALPIKTTEHETYLLNAARVFRLCSDSIGDEIQIHTHMCYSDFTDIISCISNMDYDVITIETTRSEMEILDKVDKSLDINSIGPGVYDIHSKNVPTCYEIKKLIIKALGYIDYSNLWINPDCGLKTRSWFEVTQSLENMVQATKEIRKTILNG